MLFSSMFFLWGFLPLLLILYFVAPKKIKNWILLLASLVFYAWGEPKYIILMLLMVLVTDLLEGKQRVSCIMYCSQFRFIGIL